MNIYKIRNFLVLIFLITTSATTYSQTGTVTGIVTNSVTKEPLIGTTITIANTTLGTVSNENGNFIIEKIPIGTYQIRASAIGFLPLVKTDIVVAAGKQTFLKLELTESAIELEGVTINIEYFQKEPEASISVQKLSAEEVRRLPGGLEDVVRAISILPGVAQVQNGRNDLIVRGGAPSENLFVVDNIESPNINHFGTQGASGGPLSFINLDFVNETSFKTGGFGAKYGDKISSVLTIDLKEGRTDRLGGKATISASQFGLNLEGPLSENGSLIFSARRSYLDFIFKAAGFSFVPEYWDFLGKANYTISSTDKISFLGIAALDNVKTFNETSEKRYDNSRILYSTQNQFVGGTTWQHLFEKGFSTVTLGQTIFTYNYQQNDTLLNPIFKNISHEYETSLRGDIVYQLNKTSELSFGLQGKFVDFASEIKLPPFYTNFGSLLFIDAVLDTTAMKLAGYTQYSQIISRLQYTFGVRVDYFNRIKNSFAFSPRLSLLYTLSPTINPTANVGQYHQAPSYVWLVANAENRNLNYISVLQYILGVEHFLRSDTKISMEGYIKNYSDYPASTVRPFLVLANTGAGFGGSGDGYASFGIDPLVSNGSGIAYGVELFLQKKLSEVPCYGLVSVSYNQSQFKALDGIARPSSFDQRWIINIGGGYILNEFWEFSGKFRLATGRPYTPYNPDGSQNVTAYNTMRIGTNHSLDVRVDRRWNFSNWNLVTYLDIQNVYNRKPLDVPIFDERTKEVKQLSNRIGILPSIGISAEF